MELVLVKENSVQACAELKSTRESLTQSQAKTEAVRRELKRSWELEAEAKAQIQLLKRDLEGMLPILIYPFTLLIS